MKMVLRYLLGTALTLCVLWLCLIVSAYFFTYLYLEKTTPFSELPQAVDHDLFAASISNAHTVGEWDPNSEKDWKEAPALAALVAEGELPPVAERLPAEPLVIHPPDQIGNYGGNLLRAGSGPSDIEAGNSYLMTEGLIKFSPDGTEFWPNLASKWEIQDEGRVFRFKIREGIRWSDGAPFTTDDIKFWYEHVLKNDVLTPEISAQFRSIYGENFELVVEDELNFSFRFPTPNIPFLEVLAKPYPWMNYIYPSHYLKQFHPDFTDEDRLQYMMDDEGYPTWDALFLQKAKFHMNPELPTLRAWTITIPPPASLVRFERNPYYWKVDPEGNQLPYLDGVNVSISDAGAIALSAQYGKLDFQSRGLDVGGRASLLKNADEYDYTVRSFSELYMLGLAFNLNSKNPKLAALFAEPHFKQAMSMGIDRYALVEAFTFGRAMPFQAGGYLPSSPYYREEDAKAYTEFAPEKANELLDGIGLSGRDQAGFRTFPDGSPITIYFEVPTTSLKGGQPDAFMLVCEYWRNELGLNVIYKPRARGLYYTRDRAGLVDLTQYGSAVILNESTRLPFLAPTGTGGSVRWSPEWTQWIRTRGKIGVEPPEALQRLSQLELEFANETDPDRKAAIAHELLDVNQEHLWIIGLFLNAQFAVVHDSLQNVPDLIPPATTLATETWSKEL